MPAKTGSQSQGLSKLPPLGGFVIFSLLALAAGIVNAT
jgi:hypothetical protein